MDITDLLNNPAYMPLLLLLIIWTLVWKGAALWRAARNGQRNWFIALLIINSLGILEIIYLFYFGKPKKTADEKNSPTAS